MAISHHGDAIVVERRPAERVTGDVAYQAFQILRWTFVALPLFAGLDKFFGPLVNWDQYLAPVIANMVPLAPGMQMKAIGLIEIVAAIVVAGNAYVGGYLVALWLWAIIANLVLLSGHYDIAARDAALSLAAVALARLARDHRPAAY